MFRKTSFEEFERLAGRHSLTHVLVRLGFFLVNIDEIMYVYCVYSSGRPVLYMTVLYSYCAARIITEMHLIFCNDL